MPTRPRGVRDHAAHDRLTTPSGDCVTAELPPAPTAQTLLRHPPGKRHHADTETGAVRGTTADTRVPPPMPRPRTQRQRRANSPHLATLPADSQHRRRMQMAVIRNVKGVVIGAVLVVGVLISGAVLSSCATQVGAGGADGGQGGRLRLDPHRSQSGGLHQSGDLGVQPTRWFQGVSLSVPADQLGCDRRARFRGGGHHRGVQRDRPPPSFAYPS